METFIIISLFIAALSYLGWQVRKQFSRKNASCAKGCAGACHAIDFQKIEAEVARREKSIHQI